MGNLFKIFIGLIPMIAFAQSNYKTGNITDCYTWGQWAQNYTTLNNVSVISGTVITIDGNVTMNGVTLGSGGLFFSGTNGVNFGGTSDIRCGGIYGEEIPGGTGKFKYYRTSSVDCSSPATQPNFGISYIYNGYRVTFGPIKRSGTYKWTKFFAVLYNRSVASGTCTSCWTSDWDFAGRYYVNDVEVALSTSNIWNNRGRLYKTTICGDTYETYENNWSFGNVSLNAGDRVEIVFNTPPVGGTTGFNRGCCMDPFHYIKVDVELTEL